MNNLCISSLRKGRAKGGDEKLFSAPCTPKKAPFPPTFPDRKVDNYCSKAQDYMRKPVDFLHIIHKLYTSPRHSFLIRKKKSFLLQEEWPIYNESAVEKTFSGENCVKSAWGMPLHRRAACLPAGERSILGTTVCREPPFLCEKNKLGRKNRISFRPWQKTFYFCTLKYHALIAPLCASVHPRSHSSSSCHISSFRFRALPCCSLPPAL